MIPDVLSILGEYGIGFITGFFSGGLVVFICILVWSVWNYYNKFEKPKLSLEDYEKKVLGKKKDESKKTKKVS